MTLQESEVFVNRSESGKALTFHIMPTAIKRMFTLSFDNIDKLRKGQYKATKLTEIILDEIKEEV